jgi:hypothetical protein
MRILSVIENLNQKVWVEIELGWGWSFEKVMII